MMEQVRLCAVWPTENWLGSSINHIQGWKTVCEGYWRALEKGCLPMPAYRHDLRPAAEQQTEFRFVGKMFVRRVRHLVQGWENLQNYQSCCHCSRFGESWFPIA